MKFRTTIEIDITDNSKPSEQDVQDLMAKIIGYGSLNIKQNAQHIPIKQASFSITKTEDISWMTEKRGLKVWMRKIMW
jgi:hypothetical protein